MSQNIPKPSSSSPIALITGASKGIGLGCARALSDHGFRIALHYRSDPELAQSVAETLGFSQTFRYDLTDEGAPAALVEEVSGRMGTVSVLVNNAGYNKDSILVTAQLEDYEHIFATNVRAALLLSKAVSKPMIKQKKRPHHQHHLYRRSPWSSRPGYLLGLQSFSNRTDTKHSCRVRSFWHLM